MPEKFAGIEKRYVMVEVNFRDSALGPLKRAVYWYRVLPSAVLENLMMGVNRETFKADKLCTDEWHKEFNTLFEGKRKAGKR